MKRRVVWYSIVVTAASCVGATTHAQNVNPVTINPGAGGNGGGINFSVPSYGSNVAYSAPFGGYGGYGGYGGTTGGIGIVSTGTWGAPIPAYGGYGFAPFGYNMTNVAIGGMPDPIGMQQNYALANSRYDLQTAQTARAYAEANFFQQQALSAARQNGQGQPQARERFNVRTAASRSRRQATVPKPTVPMDQLMTRDGQVKWPASAPSGEGRDRVDTAVSEIAKEIQQDGAADVATVNEARDALYAFGLPALAQVRKTRPASGPEFKDFLNNVDAVLISLAGK